MAILVPALYGTWIWLAIVKHGGILRFNGSKYAYDGGLTEEIVIDSDRVSYQEMNGILIDRGHVEANFRIYFKVGVNLEFCNTPIRVPLKLVTALGTMTRCLYSLLMVKV
ncbi:hypothetical protein ACFE04_003361 [Oxalis oulophora]